MSSEIETKNHEEQPTIEEPTGKTFSISLVVLIINYIWKYSFQIGLLTLNFIHVFINSNYKYGLITIFFRGDVCSRRFESLVVGESHCNRRERRRKEFGLLH